MNFVFTISNRFQSTGEQKFKKVTRVTQEEMLSKVIPTPLLFCEKMVSLITYICYDEVDSKSHS